MPRSVWKGPFVDSYVLKKAEKVRESGRNEVYVWPRSGAGRWQISNQGGTMPRWVLDDEIAYLSGTKIMTVADIYDALTAGDRPYKQGLAVDRALDILAGEAKAGKIEQGLFELFVESKAYDPVTNQ